MLCTQQDDVGNLQFADAALLGAGAMCSGTENSFLAQTRLGLSAISCWVQGLHTIVCTKGVCAVLNMTRFGSMCWGRAEQHAEPFPGRRQACLHASSHWLQGLFSTQCMGVEQLPPARHLQCSETVQCSAQALLSRGCLC